MIFCEQRIILWAFLPAIQLKQLFRTRNGAKQASLASLKSFGTHVGRVMVRFETGGFALTVKQRSQKTKSINHKYCQVIQRNDGYSYGYTICASKCYAISSHQSTQNANGYLWHHSSGKKRKE